jgi:uncharacterized protein
MNEEEMAQWMIHYDPLKRDTLIDTDPFRGSWTQTNRMRAFCEVWVDGINITNRIEPHLISVRVVDGTPKKTAELEIDDRDALLPIPPMNASVQVLLGWAKESMVVVFNGKIQDFEHGFGRKSGGRRMWVHAEGTTLLGNKLMEPMQDNMGDGAPPGKKLGEMIPAPSWINKIVQRGGATAQVDSYFSKFKKDHWQMMGESPIHKITSLGEEMGAMVQWDQGNKLRFEVPGRQGLSVVAQWGDNLIGWRVRPFLARTAFKGAQKDAFTNMTSKWEKFFMDRPKDSSQGPNALANSYGNAPGPAATADTAGQTNDAAVSATTTGVGRIVINGEPKAVWNSYVWLRGARPGVDGLYLIWVAEHIYSRQGYVTWLDVKPFAMAPSDQNVYNSWPLPRPAPNA